MAVFSVRAVAPIRGYHVYNETWELSLVDRVNFQQHNGKRFQYRRTYNLQKWLRDMFTTIFC